MIRYLILTLALTPISVTALDFSGHGKYRLNGSQYSENSYFHQQWEDYSYEQNADLRFSFKKWQDSFHFHADYQLTARQGDITDTASVISPPPKTQRLLNLEREIDQGNRHLVTHQLDRLSLGFSHEHWVLKIGRQTVSWGNGLSYQPLDLFNPFSPIATDTEYKAGDDMIYSQYLFDNGSDIQAIIIGRRDAETDSANIRNTSFALKFHGFATESEYDLLLAKHFNEDIFGVGFTRNAGDATWRGDATITHTAEDNYASFATNLSYAWVAWQHNLTGSIEYFYNGFGLKSDQYSQLANSAALRDRLQRGELFTVGKHYMATAITMEVTPLVQLTSNTFINLLDPSALTQLALMLDLSQNVQALADVRIPIGPNGSEFGGLSTPTPDIYLSQQVAASMQIACYF